MSKCKYCGIDGGTHACNPKDITVNMQKQDIAILRQGIAEQSKRVRELEDCLQATRAYINELEILVDERTATIEQLQLDNARMREALEDKSTLITSQGLD